MPAPGKSVLVAAERRGGESMVTLSKVLLFHLTPPVEGLFAQGPWAVKTYLPQGYGSLLSAGSLSWESSAEGGKKTKGDSSSEGMPDSLPQGEGRRLGRTASKEGENRWCVRESYVPRKGNRSFLLHLFTWDIMTNKNV